MFWFQILFSLIIGLIIALILSFVLRRSESFLNFLALFLLLFLAGLAGALWVRPFGPVVYDVYWVPILVVVIIFFLLLAALLPERGKRPGPPQISVEEKEDEIAVFSIFGIFFWVLMIFLAFSIIYAYSNSI